MKLEKSEKQLLKMIQSGMYRDFYLIYNRKSTDEPDNQKNSIKYQKAENARFASKEKLRIAPITLKSFCVDGIISEKHSGFKEDNEISINEAGMVQFRGLVILFRNGVHAGQQVGDAYVPYMEKKLDYWERQSMKLFGREIAQTLLIHANFINSDYFDDLVAMFKRRGYKFVDLETALKDEAYRLPDNFTGGAGISWLHRWALDRGRENVLTDEPMVPEFVLKLSGFESE